LFDVESNVGRQIRELEMKDVSIPLLHLYCIDQQQGNTPQNGLVFKFLNPLQARNLWHNMDTKLHSPAMMGGCAGPFLHY
jgi:hypothetical protein